MALNKKIERNKIKKIYKEEIKKLPKNKRPTFAVFLKYYEQQQKAKLIFNPEKKEDFNFEEIVNINDTIDKQ